MLEREQLVAFECPFTPQIISDKAPYRNVDNQYWTVDKSQDAKNILFYNRQKQWQDLKYQSKLPLSVMRIALLFC